MLPDREWNVPGGGGGGDDGGGDDGGGGGGGDGGGAQGARSAAVHASPAESRPSSASGTRNLLCSKGCGRSFGWPPARASHEKLCKMALGGVFTAATKPEGSSHADAPADSIGTEASTGSTAAGAQEEPAAEVRVRVRIRVRVRTTRS